MNYFLVNGDASQASLDVIPKIILCDPLNDIFVTSFDHPRLIQDLSYFVLYENEASFMLMNRCFELIRHANSILKVFLIKSSLKTSRFDGRGNTFL